MKPTISKIELDRAVELARVRVVDTVDLLERGGRNIKNEEIDIIYDQIYSAIIDYISASKLNNQN